MRFYASIFAICAIALFGAQAAFAQMGVPDIGQAASQAAGAVKDSAVDSAKKAATDRLTKATETGKAAAGKACAEQAETQGLTGKALRAFVSSCKKSAPKS